jgi:hypothetical protein
VKSCKRRKKVEEEEEEIMSRHVNLELFNTDGSRLRCGHKLVPNATVAEMRKHIAFELRVHRLRRPQVTIPAWFQAGQWSIHSQNGSEIKTDADATAVQDGHSIQILSDRNAPRRTLQFTLESSPDRASRFFIRFGYEVATLTHLIEQITSRFTAAHALEWFKNGEVDLHVVGHPFPVAEDMTVDSLKPEDMIMVRRRRRGGVNIVVQANEKEKKRKYEAEEEEEEEEDEVIVISDDDEAEAEEEEEADIAMIDINDVASPKEKAPRKKAKSEPPVCKICFDGPANAIISCCGHVTMCVECSRAIRVPECPRCNRAYVAADVRLLQFDC